MGFYKHSMAVFMVCWPMMTQLGCSSDQSDSPAEDTLPSVTAGATGFNGPEQTTAGQANVAGQSGTAGNTNIMNIQDAGNTNGQVGASGSGAQNGSAGSAAALCGNGRLDPGEECDPNLSTIATCEGLGAGTGVVSCDATCHNDIGGCKKDAVLFTVNSEISSEIGTVGIVTWSVSAEPITEAYIEFGPDTNYGMAAPVDLAEPQYRTLLLGMKGSKDYHFRVVAKNGNTEYKSDDYVLTTGPVTNLAQVLEVNVSDESARSLGFFVTSLIIASGPVALPSSDPNTIRSFAFIADTDGDIVWWYASGLESTSRARMSYDGKNMWMASAGRDGVDQVERVTMDGLDSQIYQVTATHDITPVQGNIMAFPSGPFFGCTTIMEITPDGTTTPVYDTSEIWGAQCHANAIRYSEAEDMYTISDLFAGDIAFVDRKTKTLLYRLRDFSFNWGVAQHGHHVLDGSIVLFNNGSRLAQELSLDPTTMQSAEIWNYQTTYSSEMLGDVQRLRNGHTIVTYSIPGRIHEVDPDKTLIQEFRFSQSVGYAVFRETLYGPPPDVTL